ncbi:hypothetical protein STAQ_32880 [Allostella sp. ATCC 35155]|nr:hypothetical protein STAQ_32880 [Stella sp. ATCC 35155]
MEDARNDLKPAASQPTEPKPAPDAPQPAAPPPREIGGPPGPEPTRHGDWHYKGRCTDF